MNEDEIFESIESVVNYYRDKNSCFGFDEGVELEGRKLKVEGYTYFCYGPDQMYVRDEGCIKDLPSEDIDKFKKKAKELYESEDEQYIVCAMDYFEYMELARNLTNKINKLKERFPEYNIEASMSDSDYIFVDVEVAYEFPKEPKDMTKKQLEDELGTLRIVMEEIMDAIKAYKY
jgi:hypothetical protein